MGGGLEKASAIVCSLAVIVSVSVVHTTYCAPKRQVSDTPYVLGWPGMAVTMGPCRRYGRGSVRP